MEVLELKAVQEEDGGPKPRKRERSARETQIPERATSSEPRSRRRGTRVARCLITLADTGTALRHGDKPPSVLRTTKRNPAEQKIPLFLASERRRCATAWSDFERVTRGVEQVIKGAVTQNRGFPFSLVCNRD